MTLVNTFKSSPLIIPLKRKRKEKESEKLHIEVTNQSYRICNKGPSLKTAFFEESVYTPPPYFKEKFKRS
jgi:hypothetical protein